MKFKILVFLLIASLLCLPVQASVQFDGTDDFVSSSSTYDLSAVSVITVSFWLYWDSFTNNDDMAVENSETPASDTQIILILPNESSLGVFDLQMKSSNAAQARNEYFTRPSGAAWHHYSIVFDNSTTSGDIKAYVDGSAQSTTIFLNTKSATGNFGNHTWYLMSRSGSSLFGAGRMEEFYIHTRELTANEVLILSQSKVRGTGRNFGSLFTYLPMHDGADGTSFDLKRASDESGNGRHATGNNGANNTGLTSLAGTVLSYP